VKYFDVEGLEESKKFEYIDRLNKYLSEIKSMKDPNIVKYISAEEGQEEGGMVALAMEYIPGGSIMYLLKFFKSFKETLVKIYVNQVVKVLKRLHDKGIVHGDLKTSNLLVDDLGTVKISDFGFLKTLYNEYCPEKVHNLADTIYRHQDEDLKENLTTDKPELEL